MGRLNGVRAAGAGASLTAPVGPSTGLAGMVAPPLGPAPDDNRASARDHASAPAASAVPGVSPPPEVATAAATPTDAPPTPAPPVGHAPKATDSGPRARPRGPALTPAARSPVNPANPPSSDKAPKNRHLDYGF